MSSNIECVDKRLFVYVVVMEAVPQMSTSNCLVKRCLPTIFLISIDSVFKVAELALVGDLPLGWKGFASWCCEATADC